MLHIGCHLSSSGGYLNMGKTAVSIGANTFQFFTRNPRGGSAKPVDPEDMEAYLQFAAQNGLGKIIAHAPYTMNACSADEKTRDFAYRAMKEDLNKMEYLPGNYYNFHPGSHVKQGAETGITLISKMLNDVLYPGLTTTVLLETMAGKGSEVGRCFEELRAIIDRVALSDKIGVCLDTCHVFDAGYDIVNHLDETLEEFDRVIGLNKLRAVHLNDSKNILGSHKDRHEKIGEGSIGFTAITAVIQHPALRDLPFVLETPNELEGYQHEIHLLKGVYE